MAQIGQFTRTESGFSGRILTPILGVDVVLMRLERGDNEKAPDYRIHVTDADGPEIGAGWTRVGEKAGEYVSVLIDGLAFAQPVHANLFRSGDAAYTLQWSRPLRRDAKA